MDAETLRAVQVVVDPPLARDGSQLLRGQPNAADVGHVRHGEHARSWRQGLLEHADELVDARRTYRCGDPLDREPVARGPYVPRDVVRRVVLVPEHDLVTALE